MKKKKVKNKRFFITGLVFSLLFIVLMGRLLYITGVKGAQYKEYAEGQWTRTIEIAPKRGAIFDRNGSTLAISMQSYRIDADLMVLKAYLEDKKITDDKAASELASALEMDKSKVEKILASKDSKGKPLQFVSLKRQAEKKSADAVNSLKYKGMLISLDEVRYYPEGSFLSHVIGHTNLEGNGINGVEQSYNEILRGVPGRRILEADRTNNELPNTEILLAQPVEGKDLTLTIDSRIQLVVERVAKETLKENSAKSVSITIMDPNNGEILAMANAPSYDPNKPEKAGKTSEEIQQSWNNPAVGALFEPGSIFKVITAAAGLQTDSVTEKDRFNSTGTMKVANATIKNDRYEANGILDLAGIIQHSDNIGFVQLGQKIGKDKLYEFIRNIGFGQKTGVDLPGEGVGLVTPLKNIGPVELATMSYGQGVAVTQVQYLAAFNAIANGGTWIKPHVMKEISHTAEDKKIVEKKYEDTNNKTIMDKDKAAQLRTYLEQVVNKGTATATFMEGYHIAGKTGTANKVDTNNGRYESGKYVSSFAGMAPSNNPKVTLIVTVTEPDPEKYYASQTAVPAAQKLFKELFTILNISPDDAEASDGKKSN
ncbi:penicillin-binding transpeptidase domain-containing protein [Clostridium swellfunianum]|uniref:peptidoglycan D,D-transpeptidase FtsI family protein n=1 Tax=Clostridium swellfunianum TaxID=1367462 RepID=UPI00202E9CDD|nr:penicillin-binding transpeptidase domain-containing protein [Clostridium swellfunianum]MCM0648030.1 penicillin-binding transpeptidase domain-containing protein [Clostridium swellfunianum]